MMCPADEASLTPRLGFQLLIYIYDMISSMSRADVKNVLHVSIFLVDKAKGAFRII